MINNAMRLPGVGPDTWVLYIESVGTSVGGSEWLVSRDNFKEMFDFFTAFFAICKDPIFDCHFKHVVRQTEPLLSPLSPYIPNNSMMNRVE